MTGKAAQPAVPSRRRQKKVQENTNTRAENQPEKVESYRKGKGTSTPPPDKRETVKDKESTQVLPGDVSSVPVEQKETPEPMSENAALQTECKHAILRTLDSLSEELHNYAEDADHPILASLLPTKLSDDLKIVVQENAQVTPETDEQIPSSFYYKLSVPLLVALSSLARKDVIFSPFKVIETKRTRPPRLDDSKHKNGLPRDHHRYHEQLTPFEHQLEPTERNIFHQPLQPTYAPRPTYQQNLQDPNMRHIPGQFVKHDASGKERVHQKFSHGWKQQPLDMSHETFQKSRKADDEAAKKWLMPTAADGIFSLGSIKDNPPPEPQSSVPGADINASSALKNLSKLVHDMQLKSKPSFGSHDDVTSMSTKEASNFTFFDDNVNTPLKSSQFSKFFSAKLGSLESESSKQEGGSSTQSDAASSSDAKEKNRQRAAQLLQMMFARKS